ncbi:MAG: GntR family transcriptional regulator [Oscillospiraceae bacterium]|nr:GntR family transcriptional regulator [Oscillospiraceae bacterium]
MNIEHMQEIYAKNQLISPLSQRVLESLRTSILKGDLQPGEKLTEENIAGAFQVSRTPARDALRILESEGLISNVPRVGLIVRQWTLEDFYNLYTISAPLEGLSCKLAAQNGIPPAQVIRLRQIIEEIYVCFQNQDREQGEAFNYEFHQTIARCSGNPFLEEILDGLNTKIRMLRPMVYRTPQPDRGIAYEDHKEILESILSGNAEEAERIGRQHMMTTLEKTMANSSLPPFR